MQEFTPDEQAVIDGLLEKANQLGSDLVKAGVPLGQPNPIPTLFDMLFEEGGPMEGRRFEFDRRILEKFIEECEAQAPNLKEAAARAQLATIAHLGDLKSRGGGLVSPGGGMGQQPGVQHHGRTTRRG